MKNPHNEPTKNIVTDDPLFLDIYLKYSYSPYHNDTLTFMIVTALLTI